MKEKTKEFVVIFSSVIFLLLLVGGVFYSTTKGHAYTVYAGQEICGDWIGGYDFCDVYENNGGLQWLPIWFLPMYIAIIYVAWPKRWNCEELEK